MNNKEIIRPLSTEMQDKVIKFLIEDNIYFEKCVPLLDPNKFDERYRKQIIQVMVDSFKKNGIAPSYNGIYDHIKYVEADDEEIEIIQEYLFDVIKPMDSTDREIYESDGLTYLESLTYLKYYNTFYQFVIDGKLGKAKKSIAELYDAMVTANNDNIQPFTLGDSYDDLLTYEDEYVPTGIDILDNDLGGGIKRGYISLWTAFRGQGKTTISITLATEIARCGHKVLYMNAEDSKMDILRKAYAHISNEPQDYFSKKNQHLLRDNTREIVMDYKEKYSDNLYIYSFPSGRYTIEDVITAYKDVINKGFTPQVIIIDYFSCLKMSTNPMKNEWKAEEDAMRKLESFTKEQNIVLHLFEQTKNMATRDMKETEGGTTKGSIAKEQISAYIFRLTRERQQAENRADLEINKARGKGSGKKYENFLFNVRCVQMDLSESETINIDDKLAYEDE